MESYFTVAGQKKSQPIIHISDCKSVLHSKSSDEALVISLSSYFKFNMQKNNQNPYNFARWEPWCVNYGFCSPWRKHEQIAELLRELASLTLSFQGCLSSRLQPSTMMLKAIKDPYKNVGLSLGLMLRELGENVMKTKRNQAKILIGPELQTMKQTLMQVSNSELQEIENLEDLAIANFVFLLMEIVDKVEELAKEVEALSFQSKIGSIVV
ncbi:putative aluminum-activated malate transporter [Helianthus anomalus]